MARPKTGLKAAWFSVPALLLLCHAERSAAKDVSIIGYLESLGGDSVAVRLNDRRVICARVPASGALSAKMLTAQYRLGDKVEMSYQPIEPVFQQSTSRYQYLEVTALQLVERPPAERLAAMLSGRLFHEGENLLERPVPASVVTADAPAGEEFAHARRVNLAYVSNLPNFIADETQKRYRGTEQSPQWSTLDTVQSEVTFQGDRTVRRSIRRNGKAWDQPFESLPGFKWYGGFGSEIRPVFDPKCPVTVESEGRSQYRYTTPMDGCFSYFYQQYQRFNPPRTGHVRIDATSGNVIDLEEEARDFPEDFELAEREEHITWDAVKLGEISYWVPVRATCLAIYYSGARFRIEVEFKNHRHFEASTNVIFH
jgi:hypothetical protein